MTTQQRSTGLATPHESSGSFLSRFNSLLSVPQIRHSRRSSSNLYPIKRKTYNTDAYFQKTTDQVRVTQRRRGSASSRDCFDLDLTRTFHVKYAPDPTRRTRQTAEYTASSALQYTPKDLIHHKSDGTETVGALTRAHIQRMRIVCEAPSEHLEQSISEYLDGVATTVGDASGANGAVNLQLLGERVTDAFDAEMARSGTRTGRSKVSPDETEPRTRTAGGAQKWRPILY